MVNIRANMSIYPLFNNHNMKVPFGMTSGFLIACGLASVSCQPL
jgi:hypothetical protein